jgi:hypothetical protein
MEKSRLERLGESQLKKYLNYVLSVYEDSITDIEEFYFEMTEETPNYKKIAGPFGGELKRLDMEYIFMCFVLNGNDFSGDVYRPEFTVDRIDHVATIVVHQVETREIKLPTYLANDNVERSYLNTLEGDGYISPWHIDPYNVDPYDTEVTEADYDI